MLYIKSIISLVSSIVCVLLFTLLLFQLDIPIGSAKDVTCFTESVDYIPTTLSSLGGLKSCAKQPVSKCPPAPTRICPNVFVSSTLPLRFMAQYTSSTPYNYTVLVLGLLLSLALVIHDVSLLKYGWKMCYSSIITLPLWRNLWALLVTKNHDCVRATKILFLILVLLIAPFIVVIPLLLVIVFQFIRHPIKTSHIVVNICICILVFELIGLIFMAYLVPLQSSQSWIEDGCKCRCQYNRGSRDGMDPVILVFLLTIAIVTYGISQSWGCILVNSNSLLTSRYMLPWEFVNVIQPQDPGACVFTKVRCVCWYMKFHDPVKSHVSKTLNLIEKELLKAERIMQQRRVYQPFRQPFLSWQVIQAAAPMERLGNSSDVTCVICLDDLKESELVRSLHCNHRFHSTCIDPWLRMNRPCPTCKKPIVSDVEAPTDNETNTTRTPNNQQNNNEPTPAMPRMNRTPQQLMEEVRQAHLRTLQEQQEQQSMQMSLTPIPDVGPTTTPDPMVQPPSDIYDRLHIQVDYGSLYDISPRFNDNSNPLVPEPTRIDTHRSEQSISSQQMKFANIDYSGLATTTKQSTRAINSLPETPCNSTGSRDNTQRMVNNGRLVLPPVFPWTRQDMGSATMTASA